MNRQEFDEMRAEFASVVFNYERFLKDGFLLDYKYNVQFATILDDIHYYEYENALMVRAITMKNQGSTDEEITTFVNGTLDAYKGEVFKILHKHQNATIVMDHFKDATLEDIRAFDEAYFNYIKVNHPAVKVKVSEEEKQLYQFLKQCFYENNFGRFLEEVKKNAEVFSNPEYTEEDYTKMSTFYYDIRKNISMDYAKRNKQYPYNKKETFKDEISIAAEEGDLKTQLNSLKRDNKKIHEEFVKIFGNDLGLPEVKLEDEQSK